MSRQVRRGEIYYADLSPAVGSEQAGYRPVLIIQNDKGNRYSPTVVVAAITGKSKKVFMPTHYPLPSGCGVEIPSLAMLEQIRTVDKIRLGHYVGRVDEQTMREIGRAIAASMGLEL